jgi:hypothetical protein
VIGGDCSPAGFASYATDGTTINGCSFLVPLGAHINATVVGTNSGGGGFAPQWSATNPATCTGAVCALTVTGDTDLTATFS